MAQTLAGVTIHLDDEQFSEAVESDYSFQQVLDSTSETISYYGAKSDRYSAAFILFEDENSNTGLSTLKTAVKTNSDANLTLNSGSFGNVRILSLHASLKQALNRTGLTWKVQTELVSV